MPTGATHEDTRREACHANLFYCSSSISSPSFKRFTAEDTGNAEVGTRNAECRESKDTAELRDRLPALKGLWPGGEIWKFNHSITHSLNHSILLPLSAFSAVKASVLQRKEVRATA